MKGRTALKAKAKPKKAPKLKIVPLRNKADKLVARSVRLRDSEYVDGAWQGHCITCERMCIVVDANGKWQKSNGWGHFIGRGCLFLRYEPENINLQCSHCNAWRDKNSMLEAYKIALDDKYGSGTYKKLEAAADQNKAFRMTVEYLQEVIQTAEQEIKFYLNAKRVA